MRLSALGWQQSTQTFNNTQHYIILTSTAELRRLFPVYTTEARLQLSFSLQTEKQSNTIYCVQMQHNNRLSKHEVYRYMFVHHPHTTVVQQLRLFGALTMFCSTCAKWKQFYILIMWPLKMLRWMRGYFWTVSLHSHHQQLCKLLQLYKHRLELDTVCPDHSWE